MSKKPMIRIDGDKLKRLFKERTGKTLPAIADELGMSRVYLQNVVNAFEKISCETAKQLEERYGIAVSEYIHAGEPEPPKEPETPEEPKPEAPKEPEAAATVEPETSEHETPETPKAPEPEAPKTSEPEAPDASELIAYAHELAKAVMLLEPGKNEDDLVRGMLIETKKIMREYALDKLFEEA